MHGILWTSTTGEENLQVSDNTISLLQVDREMTKEELERVQIEHYRDSVRRLKPELAFEIESQSDKPDFRIRRGTKSLGLDVAALAFTKRRKAVAQFRKVRDELRAAYLNGQLRSCRGLEILLRFSKEQVVPCPNRISAAISQLIAALETFKIDEQVWSQLDGSKLVMGLEPEPFPMGESGSSADGSISWYVVGDMHAQNSFARECGFNVEHQYLETVTAANVKSRIEEIVAKHDKSDQGIDELVIVAAGPDRYGDTTADEAMLADTFAVTWKGIVENPKNIGRVVMDNWGSNQLHVLFVKEAT